MSIENLRTIDPFADTGGSEETNQASEYIHIRIQQRNGRKTLTTVQGVPHMYSAKKVLKEFKKEFACNGTIISDAALGDIIQLQGDQRVSVRDFLVKVLGIKEDLIKIHGF